MTEHSAHLAHQFDDLEQQREASYLGMWLFLVTEIMFFGGLFTVYTVYRSSYLAAFASASHTLDLVLGTVNTAILLTSSLTMALAVHASQTGRKKSLIAYLAATMAFGGVFLVVKAFEYAAKFREHHVPGPSFHFVGTDPVHAQLFFSLYFAMTGMHALHMLIGFGLMIWLVKKAAADAFSPEYHSPVVIGGLYWHFVDIVWIFLYPLLYLVGARR